MQQFQWNQIFSWPLETFRLHINRCEVIFDSLNPNDWRQLKCNNTLLSGDWSRRRNSLSREPLLQSWTVFRAQLAVTCHLLLNHSSWLLNSFEPRELKDGQKTQPHSSADQGAAGAGKKDSKSE